MPKTCSKHHNPFWLNACLEDWTLWPSNLHLTSEFISQFLPPYSISPMKTAVFSCILPPNAMFLSRIAVPSSLVPRLPGLWWRIGCHARAQMPLISECQSSLLYVRTHLLRYTTTRWDRTIQLINSIHFSQLILYKNKFWLGAKIILQQRFTIWGCKAHPKQKCTDVQTTEENLQLTCVFIQ